MGNSVSMMRSKEMPEKSKPNRVVINGTEYWKFTFVVGKKQNKRGKWVSEKKSFYGLTKKEALAKYEAFKAKQSGSLNTDTCLGEFLQWWEENIYAQDTSLTDSTKVLHRNSFHSIFDGNKILGRAISEVTGADLQAVLYAASVAPTTKRHCKSFLKRFYTYLAVQHIALDITSALIVPKAESRKQNQEIEVFTDDELRMFLDNTPSDHRLRLLVVLAIHTGARISELLALTYDDLKNGQMRITKALKEIEPVKGSGEQTRIEVSKPKTQSSIRTIPLEPICFIQKEIDQHRKWHTTEMMRYGYRTDYVFTTLSGELYYISSVRTAYSRLCKRAGIEQRGFHTFRHTFGTRLAKSGVPITEVSKLMGHDSVSVTAKYYIDIDDQQKRDAVKKIALI